MTTRTRSQRGGSRFAKDILNTLLRINIEEEILNWERVVELAPWLKLTI
jgi:hypothetical protein